MTYAQPSTMSGDYSTHNGGEMPKATAVQLTIAAVAESTAAGRAVFKKFGERERFRRRTDLNRLFNAVREIDANISEEQFLEVFKQLQAVGAGSLIIGRKNNPNRFAWKYNLKEVARVAREGKSLEELIPFPSKKRVKRVERKARRRRKNGKAKVLANVPAKPVQAAPMQDINIQINLKVPASKANEVSALLQLAKNLEG